ncbi:MAG: tetratricopeptide repeat protein, partial [Nitratireductor sp.]
FYEKVPADSPLSRIAGLQLGLNLADLDRHEAAKVHLRQLLRDDPDDMRAYLALGGVLASKEEYGEAALLYDDAVERIDEPERADWNVFYQRGIAYERLKQWEKAEPNFRKALELYPDQPQVLNYLGYSWVDMNMNLEQGLDLIRRAVASRPNDGYIVDSLGWAYYRLGRFEEAVTELERAVSLKPDDPILNDHLGDAYWRAGRRLEATFQWAHARDMKPDPDVLVEVERKLAEGLPPLEEQKAEIPPIVLPEPASEKTGAPAPEGQGAAKSGDAGARPASHVVGPGQSLWSIAAEKLGDGGRYIEILDLNPQLRGNPSNIVPGQELILPGN